MIASKVVRRSIVVVGGGVGAVEALLALTDLGEHAFEITLVAPNDRFTLRALSVSDPFAAGHHPDVASLADLARTTGATLKRATVTSVDVDRHLVSCSDGSELHYDCLVLAPGATPKKAYEHALTFGIGDSFALNGLLADLEQGYTHRVAFVVPNGVSWALPLYELALMTARQVHGMGVEVELIFVTPEPAPLAVFGPEASAAVAALLAGAKITTQCGLPATVERGRVLVGTVLDAQVERIVSLPLLEGAGLVGVTTDADGFIPIDEFCRVHGVDDVYAVGDATDVLVKQGGLACQQADVAAGHIAHRAGASLTPKPLSLVLRGRLVTGGAGAPDNFLRRDLSGAHGDVADQELWWPPAKVYGRYLSPWVAHLQLPGRASLAPAEPPPGIDVELPLRREAGSCPDIHSPLDSLGPIRA